MTRLPRRNCLVASFIVLSIGLFLALGKTPTTMLIRAGVINGLIFPVGVGVII